MPPIRVILVDDHRAVHEAVSTILSTADDIELVGQASNGDEAIHLCRELESDVVLMDIVMPVLSGVAATSAIRGEFPDIKILVLSSFQDDDSVRAMLESGASGYVVKSSLAHDLANTIRATFYGKAVFSSEIAEQLFTRQATEPLLSFNLTDRELEVLKLMAEGANNAEIAYRLTISQSTVKFHIVNILDKMGVDTRSEALVLAAKNSLI